MKDFLCMNRSTYTGMAQNSAAFLSSEAFRGAVRTLQEDPRALARLTINLLDNVALDPLEGCRLADFVGSSGPSYELAKLDPASASIWFNLRLDRVVNFVGSFTLPREAPECKLLLEAIQRNLDSKMFKAAAIHRRMERKRQSRTSRFERVAQPAYQAVLDKAMLNPLYVSRSHTQEVLDLREQVLLDAQRARSAVFDPLVARREARCKAVITFSASDAYRTNYMDMLATFAMQYIVPEHKRALAEFM